MSRLVRASVASIGLLGPGFDDWEQARPLLAGPGRWASQPTRVPLPEAMPPAERRRCGMATKTALAVGQQALKTSPVPGHALASVFTSSGGDAVNCHEICAALASADRVISPTRFHNSVHNAPSGYWSISTGSLAPSSVLCAHDGSFAAGLLEALTQAHGEQRPVLLLAYDTRYPEPLFGLRPIPDAFGVALLLTPAGEGLGAITLDPAECLGDRAADPCDDPAMEPLRTAIPAARCLPLLSAFARGETRNVSLDYLDGVRLRVRVEGRP